MTPTPERSAENPIKSQLLELQRRYKALPGKHGEGKLVTPTLATPGQAYLSKVMGEKIESLLARFSGEVTLDSKAELALLEELAGLESYITEREGKEMKKTEGEVPAATGEVEAAALAAAEPEASAPEVPEGPVN